MHHTLADFLWQNAAEKVCRDMEGHAWQLKPQPAPSLHILSAVLVQTLPMDVK